MRSINELCVVWTGGTRGFGAATLARLAREGARVALCARNGNDVERVVAEINAAAPGRALGMACDVRRYNETEKFAEFVEKELGHVDVLVNSAGTGRPGNIDELPLDAFNEITDTNLKGTYHAIRAFLPLLRKSPGSLIVNVGSVGGKRAGAGHAAYSASKFGVAGLSQSLSRELRPQNIRVCHLAPGGIETHGNPHPSLKPEDLVETFLYLIRLPPGVLPVELEIVPTNEGF